MRDLFAGSWIHTTDPGVDTVVTFFPSTHGEINEPPESGEELYRHIHDKLTKHPHYPTQVHTVFDLMALTVLMSSSLVLVASHQQRTSSHNLDVFYMHEKLVTINVRPQPLRKAPATSVLTQTELGRPRPLEDGSSEGR